MPSGHCDDTSFHAYHRCRLEFFLCWQCLSSLSAVTGWSRAQEAAWIRILHASYGGAMEISKWWQMGQTIKSNPWPEYFNQIKSEDQFDLIYLFASPWVEDSICKICQRKASIFGKSDLPLQLLAVVVISIMDYTHPHSGQIEWM